MEDNIKLDQNNTDTFEWINKISFVMRQFGLSQSDIAKTLIAFLLIRRIDCQMQPWYKRIRNEYVHSLNADVYTMVKDICGLKHFNFAGFSLSEMKLMDLSDNIEDQFDFYVNSFDKETIDILSTLNFHTILLQIRSKIRLILSILVNIDLNSPMSVEVFHIMNRQELPFNLTSNELYDIMSYYLFDNTRIIDNAVIFDPWCSYGDRLVYAKKYAENRNIKISSIRGTEPSAIYANWGKAFSIICGMEDTCIDVAASYERPCYDTLANYIISIPPFRAKFDSIAISEMEISGMYPIGVNSTCRPELLFMQMVVYYLAKDGRAAIVVPEGVNYAATPKDKEIRSWLINNDFIDSIIKLPHLSTLRTGINLCLWILDKNKPIDKVEKITFVDLNNIVSTIKVNNPHDVILMNYIQEHCEQNAFNKYTITIPNQDLSVYNITLKNIKSGKCTEVNVPFKESKDLYSYLKKIGYNVLDNTSWAILFDKTSKEFIINFSSLFGEKIEERPNPFQIIKEMKDTYSLILCAIERILSLKEPKRRTSGHDIGSWISFVPNHWFSTTIDQVANCSVATKPIANKDGNLPICDVQYLRGNSKDVQYASTTDKNTFVQIGDYVIIRVGANSGEVFEIKENGVLGASLMLIRPKSKLIAPKYIGYFLKAMTPFFHDSANHGIAMKNLSLRAVESAGFYYPDLEEQNRIVDYLDEICGNIDAISESLRVKVPKLEQLKESIIYDAVTGKICL